MSDQNEKTSHGNEYEREPVPEKALLGFKSFVGMYAGEHCAGTELMIGPLFVAAGVSAFDIVAGLLIGNLLAVLSWMLFCAPIATRTRLTLYYQAEKICGRHLVTIYNLANGVMFTILAGAMIMVATTAFGQWFKLPMPGLNDMYPNSAVWIIAVLLVGSVISLVASCGYKMVSNIANMAAPWLVLMFIVCGIIALGEFIKVSGREVNSATDLWELADKVIWRGGKPFPGQVKFSFWHVMFFAWFCNMAWHIGMSDLTIFRFARRSWYGAASATGMYLGHFIAWLAAGMLYSLQMYKIDLQPAELDALREAGILAKLQSQEMILTADTIRELIATGVLKSPPAVLPGPMTYSAVGVAGLICVIMASWTTANPTIYRAGLAFQAIMPRFSRFKVTFVIGLIATLTGMFPAVAMQLLDFVALWGLILMPMGAIIFVDFWLFKKLGLKSNYAELSKKHFNIAAGLAWLISVSICFWLAYTGKVQIYFVSLPGWFLTTILYISISMFYQKRKLENENN